MTTKKSGITHWVAWEQYGNLACYHFTNEHEASAWYQHLISDPTLDVRAEWGPVTDDADEARRAIVENRTEP